MTAVQTRTWRSFAALSLVALALSTAPVVADEGWNPFRDRDEAARRFKKPLEAAPPGLPPMTGSYPRTDADRRSGSPDAPPLGFGAAYPGAATLPDYARPLPAPPLGSAREALNTSKVERLEPEPAMVAEAGGLPMDIWRGLDVKTVEETIAGLSLPPQSGALHALWTRLLTASAEAPGGGRTPAHFDAVRLELLYRSGLIGAMGARLEATAPDDPIFQAFAIRRDLALNKRESACGTAKKLIGRRADLPKPMIGELHLLTGYCAAAEGNMGGAGVAADLAREEGIDAPVALAALEALAGHGKGPLTPPKQVHVLDYRLLELLGPVEPTQILDRAEPALYTALALQDNADPRSRVAAAEVAARLNAISAAELTAIYQNAPADADDPQLRRAELVRLIANEQSAQRKLQLMKSVVDDARRNGLLQPVARVLAPMLAGLAPSAELQANADTAIEVSIAAGDTRRARAFADASGARHWLPLIDIAESGLSEDQREGDLAALDEIVRRGRFPAEALHRLATVLDATDVNVPIPLWEAMSRTPQPGTGHLPETGVLAQLQDAAKRKEIARSVLLVMRALGPNGADGAHIIALGDSIRALRRVGLDRDARALGVEALIAQWPRGGAS